MARFYPNSLDRIMIRIAARKLTHEGQHPFDLRPQVHRNSGEVKRGLPEQTSLNMMLIDGGVTDVADVISWGKLCSTGVELTSEGAAEIDIAVDGVQAGRWGNIWVIVRNGVMVRIEDAGARGTLWEAPR